MIDWSRGYSATYFAAIVDTKTWGDSGSFDITGGSISREDSDLRQSADIDTVNYELSGEKWIRIYMTVRQGSEFDRIALFTGLATSPSKDINGLRVENSFECYSVLKPLSDILLTRGWYASVDMDCATLLEELLSPIGVPYTIGTSSLKLKDYIVAEDNETNLSMIDKILDLMGWRMYINGDGSIYIGKYDKEEKVILDSRSNDIMEPSINIEKDWFDCPNVLRVISDDEEWIEYDRSDNPWSITKRGREVWAEESDCNLTDGESIELYAKRKLAELQQVSEEISYTRSFNPNINVSDLVRLNYPAQNISGLYYVTSQSITLGYNARTSEEVVRI